MKNLIVMAVATLFATTAGAADMKWSGDATWRYDSYSWNDNLSSVDSTTTNNDTSTQKTRRHQVGAHLGLTGGWEHVEYGIAFRTSSAANSEFVSVAPGTSSSAADATPGIDQGYLKYLHDFGSLDFALTIGRMKSVLNTDQTWQTLYSNATRFNGFGWNFKFGMFGLNAAQYIDGSNTGSSYASGSASAPTGSTSSESFTQATQAGASTVKHFSMLYAFQPYMNWKFSDEIETTLSVGYNKWVDANHVNYAGGLQGGETWNAGTVPNTAQAQFRMYNRSQWDFLNTWQLPSSFNFTAEVILGNKATYDNNSLNNFNAAGGWSGGVGAGVAPAVSRTAWNLGLTYGKLRKANDWMLGYAYGKKGIASEITDYANEFFGADQAGHQIQAGYNVADNLSLQGRAYFLKEQQCLSPNTGLTYAGTVANQKLGFKMWELSAGVNF